jgi:hypothetical protein
MLGKRSRDLSVFAMPSGSTARSLDLERWEGVAKDFAQSGFGYIETETKADSSYGISWSAPSWVMKLLENDSRVRIVAFQEAAWDNHQDVVVLQRRPIER